MFSSSRQGPPGEGELVVSSNKPVAVGRGGARIARLRILRPWIALNPRLGSRSTMLVLVLSRPGPIRFVVTQLSPACRRIGAYTAPGHEGKNRIRLRARSRMVLTPGTYKLTVRPLGVQGRARSRSVKFVVAYDRRPRSEIRAALAANSCGAVYAVPPVSDDYLPPAGDDSAVANGGLRARDTKGARASISRNVPVGRLLPDGRVLGATFAELQDGHAWAVPVLFTLVMLSMTLLGLAALPPWPVVGSAVAAAVAYRRLELRIAGVATLLFAAVLYLLLLVS